MKTLLIIILFTLCTCIACSRKSDRMILGKWKVEEYWASGIKHTSDRYIEFKGDGTYASYGEDLSEATGEWRIKEDVLVLYQPEIKDMHGNRVADSFSRIWKIDLAPEWMMMEGTPNSQTQDMKLVLQKYENE